MVLIGFMLMGLKIRFSIDEFFVLLIEFDLALFFISINGFSMLPSC